MEGIEDYELLKVAAAGSNGRARQIARSAIS